MRWLEHLEGRFIFRPTAAIRSTPAVYGAAYEDVSFRTDDGTTLHGWFPAGSFPHSGPPQRDHPLAARQPR